jgi:hypothetical protein
MQDKTAIGNNEDAKTPSKAFREYIESLVEEIVLNNANFNDHKKYLQRYSQEEGLDYATLEKNLTEFFETVEELKSKASNAIERLAKLLAKDCYLEEGKVDELLAAMNEAREKEGERIATEKARRKAEEEAKRRAKEEAERKAREEAEHKAREERERKAREEAERKAREAEKRKAEVEQEAQRKDNLEKRIQENYKKLQELEDKANSMIEGVNKEKEEKLKTLGLLNELKNQLQIYLNNLKSQSTPIINTVNLGWSAMFVEQLRQAYCRKDIAFLDNAFSSNAQITTGAFEKSGNNLRYRTQGKQQYMANLKDIFQKNRTIDVKFWSDNLTGLLYASADGRCQVLRWLQTWYSDNYSDTGYLFLVLYADQNGPKVYVRAWQPQFINGRHITLQELNGINNVTGLI